MSRRIGVVTFSFLAGVNVLFLVAADAAGHTLAAVVHLVAYTLCAVAAMAYVGQVK